MTPDSFANALRQLDPGSRALLDLSLRRGLDDAEIAELLGSDSDYVSSSRDAAIAQLAEDLGMHGDADAVREALQEMPEDAWRPAPEAAGTHANGSGAAAPLVEEAPAEAEPEPEEEAKGEADAEPASEPRPEPAARHPELASTLAPPGRPVRRPSRLVLAGLLLAGLIVAIVLAVSGGGGSSKSSSTPAASKPAPAGATNAAGRSTPLASLGGSGKGSATLDGQRLTLTVSGLPAPVGGSYEVWLYNDEIDAQPLTSFRSGSATVRADLPAVAARYRYLDVSFEPADGNPNHSGQSVLRVPLAALRR
jgi:hypothetical protein